MESYHAVVETITDTEIKAIYRQEGMPAFGIGIPLGDRAHLTPRDVRDLLRAHADKAFMYWRHLREQAVHTGRGERLQHLCGLELSEHWQEEQQGVIEL